MASEVRARSRRGSGANGARPQRRLFTVDEYERLIAADIVHEGEPVELMAGEIVRMAALGPRHTATLDRIVYRLNRRLPETTAIRTQAPIRLPPHAEPQPDIAIVLFRNDFYAAAHPGPEEVLLLIEIADTSLRYDRNVKLQLYAAAGIREVWIVDLVGSRVLVGRSPAADGYAELTEVGLDGVLTPLAFPDITLTVEEMLG